MLNTKVNNLLTITTLFMSLVKNLIYPVSTFSLLKNVSKMSRSTIDAKVKKKSNKWPLVFTSSVKVLKILVLLPKLPLFSVTNSN